MKLPENLKIKINNDYFKKYLLSQTHYFGKFKMTRLANGEHNDISCDHLKDSLGRIPLENEYLKLNIIYKLGFIYKVVYITTVVSGAKQFYARTIWTYDSKSKMVEFVNIEIIK